jgi:hypothetical protein
MLKTRNLLPLPALAAAGVLLASLQLASVARATPLPPSPPANVTVRVEGLNETRLLPTQVTTAQAPVVKDGNEAHACPGGSALGALQVVTGGNWSGPWNSKFNQYEVFSIEGETHEFEPASKANYFWSFWLDGKEAEVGACEAAVHTGDSVLFFPACFGEACPAPAPLPLGVEAPGSANVGEPVRLTVKQFSPAGAATAFAGASVTGGAGAVVTDAHGGATTSFAHAGETLLRVTGPGAIRTETTVCVHAGNDGTCGTPAPPGVVSQPRPSVTAAPPPAPYHGPYAVIAQVASLHDQQVYSARRVPRLITGSVSAHVAVASVALSLRRRYHGRCYAYDAVRERFARSRCGTSRFFGVSRSSSFSYLLPGALPRGAYVLQVRAMDAAGNVTTPTFGKSEIRFYVR